jgi:hypothetical protein
MTDERVNMTRDEITGMAALHCRLAEMDGYKLDKKAKRYTAMADYMEHVAACGVASPICALSEAVEMAIHGSPLHTGEPFDRSPWVWMELTYE